jgi:hypothetical protein
MASYLSFTFKSTSDSGKTNIWSVKNCLSGVLLGWVKWRGGWRKYVLETEAAKTAFDSGCLREIADFLDERTQQHPGGTQ